MNVQYLRTLVGCGLAWMGLLMGSGCATSKVAHALRGPAYGDQILQVEKAWASADEVRVCVRGRLGSSEASGPYTLHYGPLRKDRPGTTPQPENVLLSRSRIGKGWPDDPPPPSFEPLTAPLGSKRAAR